MEPLASSTTDPIIDLQALQIFTTVPGLDTKNNETPQRQKLLTLEMINSSYNDQEWTQVYTDGSAENAVRNGGAGIYILYPSGDHKESAFPTGELYSNYRAETSALLHAVQMILDSDQHPSKVVFFTDCKSVLQA